MEEEIQGTYFRKITEKKKSVFGRRVKIVYEYVVFIFSMVYVQYPVSDGILIFGFKLILFL